MVRAEFLRACQLCQLQRVHHEVERRDVPLIPSANLSQELLWLLLMVNPSLLHQRPLQLLSQYHHYGQRHHRQLHVRNGHQIHRDIHDEQRQLQQRQMPSELEYPKLCEWCVLPLLRNQLEHQPHLRALNAAHLLQLQRHQQLLAHRAHK